MKILVFERNHGGHRFTVVRVLLEALLSLEKSQQLDFDITLATSATAVDSVEFHEQLSHFGTKLSIHKLTGEEAQKSPLGAAWQKLTNWREIALDGRYQHIFVPYGDGLMQLLSFADRLLFGFSVRPPLGTKTEMIMMRGSYAYPASGKFVSAVAYWSTRFSFFDRIHLIDPLPFRFIKAKKNKSLSHVHLLPDPITPTKASTKSEARRRLGIDESIRLMGCVGKIDSRKGANRLIRAFVRADLGSNTKLLLAGSHDDSIREQLSTTPGDNIISLDRYLDEAELCDAVSALDLVTLPYPDFVGSVSMVLRAADVGRPCLAADDGWSGFVIPEFDLGTTCDVTDESVLVVALGEAIETAPDYEPGPLARKFVEYESIANVNAHWTTLLRERLELPPDPAKTEWPEGASGFKIPQ